MKLNFLLLIFVVAPLTVLASDINPDSIKINKRNWVYFGWEEDHPKANSLMGGGLYARRPKLDKGDNHSWEFSKDAWHPDSDKPLFFMVSVDGSEPFYPDEFSPKRHKEIHWHLAERSLPFPVSSWEFGGVRIQITHVGRRILGNSMNVVYTRVVVTNVDNEPHDVSPMNGC